MNNVLLVGNGFDLAHGLLTKYEHFWDLITHWSVLYAGYKGAGPNVKTDSRLGVYRQCMENADINAMERLNEIITNNSWIHYYSRCGAEIDGWIDFEKEIYPVINLFETMFKNNYVINDDIVRDGRGTGIDYSSFTSKDLEIARLWNKYIDCRGRYKLKLCEQYVSRSYGVLKKKIITDLRKEFEDFIEAFEIYLHEFVYKNGDVKPLKQIKELNINSVISFNYTLTEKLYGIAEYDVHHLHGMIREDMTKGKNNMVMGVGESAEQNMDFIYFVKYFQRIRKASGIKYKELVKKQTQDGNMLHSNYNLYIYGHSLDETDADILKYVIGDRDSEGKMQMISKRVVVFYYDETDYEQKVINLINLYGRDIVEDYMERNRFEFLETSKEISEV